MRKSRAFLGGLAVLFTLFLIWGATADAARLGGGKSFGSSPSYSRSAPAPSAPSTSSPQYGSGTTARPTPGMSPSPLGGWGGMLGGMLMGGLIGSLLFGGGGSGWGGPSLIDLVVIGGGLLLLFRFLRSRREAAQGAYPFDGGAAQPWGTSGVDPAAAPAAEGPPPIPADFDQAEFMKGAKVMYNRLQASWDRRDLDDIRQFTSNEVYDEIRRQAQESPAPSKTELLLVTPRLLEVRNVDGRSVASVLYDVMMRETEHENAHQVREIWHFSRQANDAKAFWVLEGIQQVEN